MVSEEAILSAENSEKIFWLHPEPHWELTALPRPVMGFKTVGLRTGSETQKIWQVLCYVVKYNLVTLVVIMILEDTAAFQVLFIVSLFCAWNITTVEINSGVHLLNS